MGPYIKRITRGHRTRIPLFGLPSNVDISIPEVTILVPETEEREREKITFERIKPKDIAGDALESKFGFDYQHFFYNNIVLALTGVAKYCF